MKTRNFDYDLPRELIAQTPVEPRDSSRLMVVSRTSGDVEHRIFRDLPKYLRTGDVLVFNDSRVIPARLLGVRVGTSIKVEVLLLTRIESGVWRALVRPGRRMREGDTFQMSSSGMMIEGEVLKVENEGTRIVRFSGEEYLDAIGSVPLPPYIHNPLKDQERYQTVYARFPGSVAAPTAGLHFTKNLLQEIRSLGVKTVLVTLHVGWASFRPVKNEEIMEHDLRPEWYRIDNEAARTISVAKREGRRIICVGTTAVRLLEHAVSQKSKRLKGDELSQEILTGESGWADLFIYPGHQFRVVDGLVTNFHLPRSTLLMLTCAFSDRDLVMEAYRLATERRYRFYSFGDAMFLL